MSKFKNILKTLSKVLQLTLGVVIFAFICAIWVTDRLIHVILIHKTHERLGLWDKNKDNIRFAIARLAIILIPILIYNALK
jgi:hypothetical protein